MTRLTPWIFLLAVSVVAWPDLAGAPPPNLEKTLQAQHKRIEQDPGNPAAWNDLGNLLVLADRYAEAEEAYRQAMALAPNDTASRFNLALLLHQQGRRAEAEKELEALLAIDPHHAWGQYQLGKILAEQKDRAGALEHYARALAYDPNLSFAENNPDIIDNPLFGEALLRSQKYMSSEATHVPRVYSEPNRIVEMMLKYEMQAKSGEEAESEDGEKTEDGKGENGEKGEGGGTAPGGAAPGGAASGGAAPGSGGASAKGSPDAANPDAGRRDAGSPQAGNAGSRASRDVQGGVFVGGAQPAPRGENEGASGSAAGRPPAHSLPRISATPPPSTRSRRAAPPHSAAPPRASAETPPPVRHTPPPPTRSSRYVPGRRSTSQLDLKLLPEDEESPVRVASVDSGV